MDWVRSLPRKIRSRLHFDVQWVKVFVAVIAIIAVTRLFFTVSDLKDHVGVNNDLLRKGRAERTQYQYEDRVLSCTGIRLADPQGAKEEPVKGICVDVPGRGQATTTTTLED